MKRQLINQVINNILIVGEYYIDGVPMVSCRCHCTKPFETQRKYFLGNNPPRKSCGCSQEITDLSSLEFDDIKVISFNGRSKNGNAMWNCECKCGRQVICNAGKLVSGLKINCGQCKPTRTFNGR